MLKNQCYQNCLKRNFIMLFCNFTLEKTDLGEIKHIPIW